MILNYNTYRLITEANTKLNLSIPKDIVDLYELFKRNDKKLYVVGGAVRDTLLGKKPKDFDLATDALPQEVIDIVTAGGFETIGEVGQQFGVVIVKIPSDKEGVEIATFREDIGKGRRPDAVEYSTIDKDVLRRDLTINALFYDIGRKEIVDLVGGVADLQSNIIRAVGDAAVRFDEDPLRKLRALRFAARTGSRLEDGTRDALLTDNSLLNISADRIRKEFKTSIESAKKPVDYLKMVSYFNLWPVMFPGLKINQQFVNTDDWLLQLALLFRGNEIKTLSAELSDLKFTGDEINAVVFLHKLLDFTPQQVFIRHKEFKNVVLTDKTILTFAKINKLDLKLIKAFLKYKPSIKGNQIMKQYGLKGKAIGDKIEELEVLKFLKSL